MLEFKIRVLQEPRLLTQPSRGSLYPVLASWAELGDPVVLPAVEPAKGASVDNFWHNDLFARICSTCGGVEWGYLVDLPVNLSSHLALSLLLALWTPCGRVAESHSS